MMPTTSVDGTSYTIPTDGARGWGTEVTNLLKALGDNSLLIKGGSIPLTSDANFGASFGLISTYFTSRTANAASAGSLRLAAADFVRWRNAANTGNLSLGVASDKLQFEGVDLATISTAQTLTNKTINAASNTLSNIDTTMWAAGVLVTSTALALASNLNVPSTLAIKTYVDTADALLTPKTRSLTAGSGLSGGGDLSADRTFDVNVDSSTIEINADTLRVKDAGITLAKLASVSVDENKIVSTAFSSTGAIVGGSGTKAAVQVDNSTIEISTNALRVKDLGITTAKIAASNVTSAKLENDIVLPGTGAVTVPVGTTGQRPGSPTNGMFRYNTTLGDFEWYDAGWATPGAGTSVASADGVTAGTVKTHVPEVHISVKAVSSANYTILDNDGYSTVLVDTGGSARTITLPVLANNQGRILSVIKSTANGGAVTVAGASAETISGSNTFMLARDGETVRIVGTSSEWKILAAPRIETTFTLNGGFSGGTCYAHRIGNIVVVTLHSPTSGNFNGATSTTALPVAFRPPGETSQIIYIDSARVLIMGVTTAGIVYTENRDWAGNGASSTSLPRDAVVTFGAT